MGGRIAGTGAARRVSLVLVSVVFVGCGADVEPQASRTATTTTDAFPVTIEHEYGSTEITEPPERVVSVGFNDHDVLLALGTVPVAVREWFGEQPQATWRWARDELGDAQPEVLSSGELDFEQIASLDPDLIVGVYSGITKDEYKALSRIAPTVAQSSKYADFGVPWQEQTRVIGRALGREEQADELVAEIEDSFAAVRAEHPEFEGATGAAALLFDGEYWAYGPQDPRARFMTALGFELPADIAKVVGDQSFATISSEQLGLLDTDVLVWLLDSPSQRKTIETHPLYRNLTAPREGRDVFVEPDPFGAALSFSTVLSLPFLLDEFVPQLDAAVDGDPQTEVSSAP